MDDEALRDYIRESYRIVSSKLPKRRQAEIIDHGTG
jgi:predicted DNA-binding protein (MmcQ/YjbR family)